MRHRTTTGAAAPQEPKMTDSQLARFISMASNELLREIIASDAKKWAWHRYSAKAELAQRGN
jgi:hypothetical protein